MAAALLRKTERQRQRQRERKEDRERVGKRGRRREKLSFFIIQRIASWQQHETTFYLESLLHLGAYQIKAKFLRVLV